MITLSLKYGSAVLTGITCTVVDQVDMLKGWISSQGTNSQLAYLSARIDGETRIVYGTMAEADNVENTLEILFQTDDPREIDYDAGQYAGLKSIIVEAVI